MKKNIALGMSGGVDSSLCAHLLVEQGYAVTGVFLECWRAPGCRTDQDRKDALAVALGLGIPFQVLDFKDAYKERVVEYFFREYEAGRTPNPDILCNSEIKFGLFFDWAMQQRFDAIATGHYAKKITLDTASEQLAVPTDAHKDQTYFLHQISQKQLQHTLFPLANMTKEQVRKEAKKKNIPVADKKDSVGICFIGDINVHTFLKERLGENPGEVVDVNGVVIGSHKGLWFYTIGQRSGFHINQTTLVHQSSGEVLTKHNIPPFYVIAKKPDTNQLVVGFGADTLRSTFVVHNIHWIHSPVKDQATLYVRIRHTGKLLTCSVTFQEDNGVKVALASGVQGVAEGQYAVLYQKQASDMLCLGGGAMSMIE
ncbi:tRNA 2-thiouridine(34) synthase MnmA [Candidatus Woesebacteria bacterium]|nr:tRNA 2-thiouridine(34) synthase MnmA [Candidatus Woesebacteria bacterium]